MNITDPSARLTHSRHRLAEFDLDIEYKRGRENKFADEIFRLHTNCETFTGDDDDIPSFGLIRPIRIPTHDLDHADPDFHFPDELPDLIEQEFDAEDHLLLTKEMQTYTNRPYTAITTEELITSQLHDAF